MDKYGIYSWNDLLRMVFDDVNVDRGKYVGEEGLQRAFLEMKKFYDKNESLPTNREKEFAGIYSALYGGVWSEKGFSSWNDMLFHIFGKINVNMNYHVGEEGLNRAISVLKELHEKYKEIPNSELTEVLGINSAVSRGNWKDYDINTWNDLIKRVFGEVKHEQGKYKKDRAFLDIVQKLRKFHKEYNRLPTCDDDSMKNIAAAVFRKRFKKYSIYTWNDLLFHVFGEINFVGQNAFIGDRGLQLATYKLQKYFTINKKQPMISDKGMHAIAKAITNGYFEESGIREWEELLLYSFGKIDECIKNPVKKENNLSQFSVENYDSETLLQEVSEFLKTFERDHNRLPKTRDSEIKEILNLIKRGYFKKLGITRWNHLLKHVFRRVNHRKKIYLGEKGLERAINELLAFKVENERIPTTNDNGMGGILKAVKRGEWKEFGITRWNHLIYKIFKRVNKKTKVIS